MIWIDGIGAEEIVFDIRCGFTEHIGNNGVQREVAHSESILKTILFTGTHGNELAAIAGEFAQNADVFGGDIAAGHKTHAKEVADPFGILLVILVALNSRDPLGVCDDNMDGTLKNIPNGNPVLAGTLHANVLAVIFKEPLLEREQTAVERGKPLLFVLGGHGIAGNDCGDEKGFVDIDAATDGIRQFHDESSLLKIEERH